MLGEQVPHPSSDLGDPHSGVGSSMPGAHPIPETDHAALMNAAPTPMFGFDELGRCIGANPAAEALCGQSAAELRGHPYSGLVAVADRTRVVRQVLRQRRQRAATSYALLHLVHANGSEQDLAVRVNRIVTAEGGEQFVA